MLVEKAGNGRIVKNEAYEISDFLDQILKISVTADKEPKITVWDKIFNTKQYIAYKFWLLAKESQDNAVLWCNHFKLVSLFNINLLIDNDVKGKKK